MKISKSTAVAQESLGTQLKDTLRLAIPVILSRLGIMMLQVVDTAMVGKVAALELAYLGIGLPPSYWLLMLGMGLLMGAGILTAQANGGGRQQEVGIIWMSAIRHGVIFSFICLAVSYLGGDLLLFTGQEPDIAEGAGRIMVAFGWGMPAVMVFAATASVMEGIKRPNISMVLMLIANVLNIGFNWVLVYGNFGFDPMGAEGAMFGSSLARWIASILFVIILLRMKDRHVYGLANVRAIPKQALLAMGKKIRRIGIPLSISSALEMMAFMVEAAMAGYMGKTALAAFQIVVNIAGFFMMAGMGIASATSVRVGNAVGRGDVKAQWTAGAIGVACVFILCGAIAIGVLLNIDIIVAVFTTNRDVTEIAFATLVIFGSFFAFNSINMVSITGQRTLGIVWLPLIVGLTTTWVVGFPLAYYLGFVKDMSVAGLWLGFSVAAQLSMLFNLWRFHVVAKRFVKAY
ncbi:MAG: MATE family multidrug resistance protein [Gammaproteobacteria bacterium]|jgi:MATE family multidrug resistance protein